MLSFRVHRVRSADIEGALYMRAAELECRHCLPDRADTDETSVGVFLLCHEPKVGHEICCPDCGEISTIPKKSRWTQTPLFPFDIQRLGSLSTADRDLFLCLAQRNL